MTLGVCLKATDFSANLSLCLNQTHDRV